MGDADLFPANAASGAPEPAAAPPDQASNLHEYSVSELAFALKRSIEDGFGRVRLRGEISGLKKPASGHLYLDLQDADAVIAGVCWKSTLARLKLAPEYGMEVIVTGKITTYPKSSKYQIVIEGIELAGEGALLKLLEDRKKKLAAEGLFDDGRKVAVPFLPEVIGVVTSPSGAVIRDILHRLADRFPRHVLLWPARVQGEGAADEIAAAIAGFNALGEGSTVPRPDVIIVARGGGGVEDLWAFNEEIVVRAAAASRIPLISAVGHETDTTLIDFAADLRAPTPSAAAELAVPVRADLIAQTAGLGARLFAGTSRALKRQRERLAGLGRGLRGPAEALGLATQRLDFATERLLRSHLAALAVHVGRLDAAANRLRPALLRRDAEARVRRLGTVAGRLAREFRRTVEEQGTRLTGLANLLESVSHRSVLARGYAVVRDPQYVPVTSVAAARPGMELDIELGDGHMKATVEHGPKTRSAKTRGAETRDG